MAIFYGYSNGATIFYGYSSAIYAFSHLFCIQSHLIYIQSTYIHQSHLICVTFCAIWYHLYNFKNVKNTHGGVLLLVKLQECFITLLQVTHLHGCFLNCTNSTKSRKTSHVFSLIVYIFRYSATCYIYSVHIYFLY